MTHDCNIARRLAFTLVEMMVALAIASALLAATGVALNASVTAYQIDQEQGTLLQATRLTLNRMITTIRTCKLHAPDDATLSGEFAAGQTVTGTGIQMFDANGLEVSFHYDSDNHRLLYIAGGSSHPLLEGVQDCQITMQPMRSDTSIRTGGAWDLLERATILITVDATNKTQVAGEGTDKVVMTLSASVMPRKNTW